MVEDRLKKFESRMQKLKELDDTELRTKFWELCSSIVKPMLDYGNKFTSPSIERSILLRMGIDSVTSQAVVNNILNAGLLGKGAGHVVMKLSEKHKISIKDAAVKITDDKECLKSLF